MDSIDIILRWYLVTTVVTIGLLPIALAIFRRVPGEGASFARPVAALLFMWPAWFLSGLTDGTVPFSPISLWAAVVLIAAAGWAYTWRRGLFTRETLRHLVVSEAGHLAIFLVFLWFRGFGPDANFQEKPSDLMMLSSVMTSSSMPPQDAWLAGEPVNYYYLGYAIWGGFGNMAGATPAETFNLALISTFAMTFVVTAGLVARVLGRFHRDRVAITGGVIGAVFLLLMGNPWSTGQVLDDPSGQWNMHETNPIGYFNGIGWEASRVIEDDPESFLNPITEFPAFSFILGDLHPHMMALPFTLLALALSWMLLTVGRLREGQSLIRRDWFRFTLAGGLIGSLYAMNSWDFPTYLVIALLALGLGTVGAAVRERVLAGVILVGTALVAWLPFYIHFEAPAASAGTEFSDWISGVPVLGGVFGSIASYTGERTSPQEFLSVFGFLYLILIALIVVETWRRREDALIAFAESRGGTWEPDPLSRNLALVTAVLCFFGAIIVPVPLLVICGLPVIFTWLLLERDARLTPANVSLVLFSLALILTLVPEFFYLSDYYGTRMNTVFKVWYQVWTLMAIASALAVMSIWRTLHRHVAARVALPAALAGLMIAGFVYPVVAGQQWLNWRAPDRTWDGVDGLLYLEQDAGGLYAGEYAAIEWLLENADEDDVILTAGGGEWDSAIGRVSGGSGVPTIIGWAGHENQWHLGEPGYTEDRVQRVNDIEALFDGTPPEEELLDRYGVTLIYIGPTETQGLPNAEATPGSYAPGPFPAAADPAFPGEGWTEVFNQDGSRIYRRDGT